MYKSFQILKAVYKETIMKEAIKQHPYIHKEDSIMKINFLKRCAATLMAVSVLSTGLTVSAAENTAVPQNAPAPTVSDASGTDLPYDQYLSALLDVCFRNDARAFVALGLGSEEDAAEIYNSILDAEMSSLDLDSILGTECPESLKNDFRTAMAQLLANARFAVAGCDLQADGSYKITIVYEKMIFFEPLMNLYTAILTDLATTWLSDPAAAPSEEDMMVQIFAALCSSMNVCLENATYAAPALTTVSFTPVSGIYLPDIGDIATLEKKLFDTDYIDS